MNVLLLMAEVPSGGSPEGIAATFGVDWPHLLAQIASFCIVCFILYRFAYHPILKMLEVRRKQIADGIANAEKIEAKLAQTEVHRRDVMMQAKSEATKFVEEARAAAARLQSEEAQKAIAAAEQIMAKAREAAALDHARMFAELRQEVGRLVVQTTAKVAGKVLTPEDQIRLAEDAARQLTHSGNGKATGDENYQASKT
jgi:F-type H+-transporting ATPase subunit b